MGKRIANNIASSNVLDYLELSDEHSIVEIIANKKIDGHSLIELDIRAKFGLNIVAIKRGKESYCISSSYGKYSSGRYINCNWS